jgi:hypothetical protein
MTGTANVLDIFKIDFLQTNKNKYTVSSLVVKTNQFTCYNSFNFKLIQKEFNSELSSSTNMTIQAEQPVIPS